MRNFPSKSSFQSPLKAAERGAIHLVAVAIVAGIVAIALVANASQTRTTTELEATGSGGPPAQAILKDASGKRIGEVLFKPDNKSGVKVHVEVERGLTPGFHGFHIHSVGQCTAPFTSAGGHLNLSQSTHRDHTGDMPVLYIGKKGTGEMEFAADRFTLADLFDKDGSAVIVHAGVDNYANIPTDRYDPDPDSTTLATGDAGGRAACGVIERK